MCKVEAPWPDDAIGRCLTCWVVSTWPDADTKIRRSKRALTTRGRRIIQGYLTCSACMAQVVSLESHDCPADILDAGDLYDIGDDGREYATAVPA